MLVDTNGEPLGVDDCFVGSLNPDASLRVTRTGNIYLLAIKYPTTALNRVAVPAFWSRTELAKFATRVTCTNCPEVFECLARGVVKHDPG